MPSTKEFQQIPLQASKVPANIQSDFSGKYPDADLTQWFNFGSGFEAVCFNHETSLSVIYDIKGNWLSTRTELSEAELPPAVSEAIFEDFPDATLMEIARIEQSEDTGYEILITSSGAEYELYITSDGEILESESIFDEFDGDSDIFGDFDDDNFGFGEAETNGKEDPSEGEDFF
jgi:hypothetical protein